MYIKYVLFFQHKIAGLKLRPDIRNSKIGSLKNICWSKSTEEFQGYPPSSDSDKMRKLILDNCTYLCNYGAGSSEGEFLGSIYLAIQSNSSTYSEGYVAIEYQDYLNGVKAEQGFIDDL